ACSTPTSRSIFSAASWPSHFPLEATAASLVVRSHTASQRRSTPCRSFGPKFFSPVSAQEFHLRFESAHARGDAFIFFRGPVDRSIDRALTDQALKLFINAQAQHLFPAAGSVSFPKIEQDDVEQRFEFK